MAQYTKNVQVGGAWVDKSKLRTGMKAKIVSETNPEPSRFTDEKTGEFKMQDCCKVRFEGLSDALKVSLNRTTLNALVDAFGGDSKDWMNKLLTVDMVKRDGKTYLYFIPQGFRRGEDTEGYTVIVPEDKEPEIPVVNVEEDEINKELAHKDIKSSDLPF